MRDQQPGSRYAAGTTLESPTIEGLLDVTMNGPGSYRCCGVRVDGYGPMAAVAALLESRFGEARGAHLCNSYTLALALRDPAYREVLNSGDLNFADGHYVALVGRWRGQKDLTERVYGPDLMMRTVDQGR